MLSALVVGGTGPTGVPIVEGLLDRGYSVTVFHTGAHPGEFSRPVELVLGDPREEGDINRALGQRRWDLAVCTSGRLRLLARVLAHRVARLVGITGQPVYAGTMRPTPEGVLALPISESAERQSDASGYTGRVAEGEDQLLAQHASGDFEAVIIRYPGIYGPRGRLAHEWAVVRRILDGRQSMLMPHDGMTYFQRGYAENVARLVVLAAEVPAAAGQSFNAGDEAVLNARRVAEVIAEELGAELDLIGLPAPLCRGVFPLAEKSSLILDLSAARSILGYRDVMGVEDATRLTARWLADHPPATGEVPDAFGGSFDYAAEDELSSRWSHMMANFPVASGRAP